MNSLQSSIRYIIYARKSSESDERQVQSIDDQLRVLRDLARDLNLTIVDTLSEAHSAKEPRTRPIFETLLQSLADGKADGILTWKIDRLSRNPIDSASIQWLLQQGKIKSIQTVGRDYRPEDNAIIFSIESSMANQYIRDLSKNVKRGLKAKIDKGIAPKCAPIGYLNTKTKLRGENHIIKDPERFSIIRKAWDLMLSGNYCGPQILDILNNEYGLRTRKTRSNGGKPLSRSGLYRLFSDPFYTGQFLYNGVLYDGTHPPMVTQEEFDHVQVILGRPGKPKQKQHPYIYTGLLRCGECGGLISATHKEKRLKATGQQKTYTLYYCIPARKKTRPCGQRRFINAEIIDEQVKAEIETFTILLEFKNWALDILGKETDEDLERREKIRVSQQKAIEAAQRQINRLTDMCAKDLLTDDEYKTKRGELKRSINVLQSKIQTKKEDEVHQIEQVLTFACDASAIFEMGDVTGKRSVFSNMCLNATLKGEKLAIQPPFWLVPIQNQYSSIKAEMEALELRFGRGTQRYKEALTTLSPLVRRLVYDIRTELQKHPLPKEGTSHQQR